MQSLEADHISRQGFLNHEQPRATSGFSPFENQSRQTYLIDEGRHPGNSTNFPDISHRDRPSFAPQFEHTPTESNANGYVLAKGSRFAKFFDGKGRDPSATQTKPQTPTGFLSPSPSLGQRQDQSGFNGLHGNHNDPRTMDDLFAMLSNSSQVSRISFDVSVFGQYVSFRLMEEGLSITQSRYQTYPPTFSLIPRDRVTYT